MFSRLIGSSSTRAAAHELYTAVVLQARQPGFYSEWEVPDTLDGRFEMIALHAFLVLHRLKSAGKARAALGQALFDTMFADMDRSLREMGAGDLGVGPRVKAMAQGFYGRIAAYEAGLAEPGTSTLADALRRNVYGSLRELPLRMGSVAELAAYVRASAARLAAQDFAEIAAGKPDFLAAPVAGLGH